MITAIKSFVQANDKPSLASFIETDWPRLEMVNFLLAKISGMTLNRNIDEAAGKAEFTTPSGCSLLQIQKPAQQQSSTNGDLADQLRAMLLAIRIHEVDSYEWVNLPPDMRKREVDRVLANAGVSAEQFHRLTSIWTS